MPITTRRAVAALGLCGALLSGCAATGGAADSGPPAITVGTPASALSISLPLDGYFQTPAQTATLDQARDLLVGACMRRFGFTLPMPRITVQSYNPEIDSRFLVSDHATATEYGYHSPYYTSSATTNGTGTSTTPTPSSAEQLILYGQGASSYKGRPIPSQGCSGQASAILSAGEVPIDRTPFPGAPIVGGEQVDVPGYLSNEATDETAADSRIVAMNVRWSSCMSRAGYGYATPRAANNDPRWQTSTPSPLEIHTALADVACKQQVNYLGLTAAVQTAYQQRLLTQFTEPLNEYKRDTTISLANATHALHGTRSAR